MTWVVAQWPQGWWEKVRRGEHSLVRGKRLGRRSSERCERGSSRDCFGGMAAPWAMHSFAPNSFLKSYIRTCHKGVGRRWRLLTEDKDTCLRDGHIKKVKIVKAEGLEETTPKRRIFTYWGQVWHRSRHHYPPSCLFVHPSSSPPGIQRVKVYSGLGLQPYCLEPLGSWVHMPFLAGLRSPWRASPVPDPHSAEGALQFLLCQKAHSLHLYPCGPFFFSDDKPSIFLFELFPLSAIRIYMVEVLIRRRPMHLHATAERSERSCLAQSQNEVMTSRLIEPYLHLSVFQMQNQPSNRRAGGHTTTNTSVSKHQQDVDDSLEHSLQKEVQCAD